jgi:hypothetical protein
MSNLPGFTAEQSFGTPFNYYVGLFKASQLMTNKGILFSSVALRLPVTTGDCLERGLCAYVSPTGRVTCGKCPGQVWGVAGSGLYHL